MHCASPATHATRRLEKEKKSGKGGKGGRRVNFAKNGKRRKEGRKRRMGENFQEKHAKLLARDYGKREGGDGDRRGICDGRISPSVCNN